MSIQSQIARLAENVHDTLMAIAEKGGAIPEAATSDHMASAVLSIPGARLNFEVLGGETAPESPEENTIWVNTAQTITGWALRMDAPETPEEGMVHISLGYFGTVEINALEENEIQMYPIAAKQYTGGAWMDVPMRIWREGAWADPWNALLYSSGTAYAPCESYVINGTVTMGGTTITAKTQAGKDSHAYARFGPVPIDHVDSVEAVFTAADTIDDASHYCDIFVSQSVSETYDAAAVKVMGNIKTKGGTGTYTLDLSAAGLTGQYSIFVGTHAPSWGNARSIQISSVTATMGG